jgi:hypothetical protein
MCVILAIWVGGKSRIVTPTGFHVPEYSRTPLPYFYAQRSIGLDGVASDHEHTKVLWKPGLMKFTCWPQTMFHPLGTHHRHMSSLLLLIGLGVLIL